MCRNLSRRQRRLCSLASDTLHSTVEEIRVKAAGNLHTASLIQSTNRVLAFNGDVIALLGSAQQELSLRRRHQLQTSLPKDISSICGAQISTSTTLFGDEVDRLMKTARESHRVSQQTKFSASRYHPYRGRGHSGRPFLARGFPHSANQRGGYQNSRGKARGQRGYNRGR